VGENRRAAATALVFVEPASPRTLPTPEKRLIPTQPFRSTHPARSGSCFGLSVIDDRPHTTPASLFGAGWSFESHPTARTSPFSRCSRASATARAAARATSTRTPITAHAAPRTTNRQCRPLTGHTPEGRVRPGMRVRANQIEALAEVAKRCPNRRTQSLPSP
jgi:hypothetical protein